MVFSKMSKVGSPMEHGKREYKAIVWKKDSDQAGRRVTIYAVDLDDATRLLEEQFGKDITYTLHNEEDANKPR